MTTEQKIIKKKWVYSNWPDNKEVMHTDSPPKGGKDLLQECRAPLIEAKAICLR
jgi:hypothetical protein